MSDCTYKSPLGRLPHRLDPFGQVNPLSSGRFRLRFADGDGGDGGGGDGGDGGDGGGDNESADVKALRGVADKRMKERNDARDALKKFSDLGLSPEEIAALVADKKKPGDAPDEAEIEKRLRKQIETDAKAKSAERFRASSVREQAATLGFIDPKEALALVDKKALADVDVDDDDEVDEAAVKKLLEDLAKAKPHLLKPTDTTPDHRQAGTGASGSGSKPEVQPGAARLRNAYANSSKKK